MTTNSKTPREPDLFLVGTRVPWEMRERLKDLAAADHRNVSQELRRLIEARVAEADEKAAA